VSLTFTLRPFVFCFFSKTNPGNGALTAGHLVAQTGHDRRWLPKLTDGLVYWPKANLEQASIEIILPWIHSITVMENTAYKSRCSGRLSVVKHNRLSYSRRARVDLETAGHGATSHGGADNRFGGKQNSLTMVANRGQRWMLWLRDNLAELAAPSIYSVWGWWLWILKGGDRRSKREVSHWRELSWHSPGQHLRRWTDYLQLSTVTW
jgi:hypothetical protein